MKTWLLPAIAALFCWGIWAFVPKITVRYLDPKSAIVYEILGGLLIGLGVLATMGFKPVFHPVGSTLGLVTGLFGFLGALFYLYAVKNGPVSLVAIATALYPLLTLILAWALLKESISPRQAAGVVLGLVAIHLLAS